MRNDAIRINDNEMCFVMNSDNSIECFVRDGDKKRVVNNLEDIKSLFNIAVNNFSWREVGNSIIFENAREINYIYKKTINKNRNINIRVNSVRARNLRKYKIKKCIWRFALISGTSLMTGSAINITSKAFNDKSNKVSIEYDFDDSKGNENSIDEIYEKNTESTIDKYISFGVDDYEVEDTKMVYEENTNFNEDIVTFQYDGNRSYSGDDFENTLRYEDIFNKYSKKYGIDAKLLRSIAAQESSGIHKNYSENGYALGIMQIELGAWNGEKLTAYNFDNGEEETIIVDKDKLEDVDYNIKVGTMIFQNNLERYDYNIPLAIQGYNFGSGNMDKMLVTCSEISGIDKSIMIDNVEESEWLNYRSFLNTGDSRYVENVLDNLNNNDNIIEVFKRDNSSVKVLVKNANLKNKVK